MHRPIDRGEIDRLVVQHLPDLLRVATRLAGDPHRAEELVQETLLRVLRRWESYRGDSSFKTWAMSILLNVNRDQHRRGRGEEPLVECPTDRAPEPAEDANLRETAAQVRQEIDRLPARQREVAILCLCEGMPAGEAAAVLQMTPNNLGVTLHAVRRRLAEALGLTVGRPR